MSDTFEEEGLLPENTRIRKLPSGDFEILIASSQKRPTDDTRDIPELKYELEGSLEGKTATIVFGDHHAEMQKVADAIREAHKYAANENQGQMMVQYLKSFETGSLEAFKESQRCWIKDKGPNVESDIGFIETYRDPPRHPRRMGRLRRNGQQRTHTSLLEASRSCSQPNSKATLERRF